MIVERDVDFGELYRVERRSLIEDVRSLSPAELATVVPATPAWTVRDVVAHARLLPPRVHGSGDVDRIVPLLAAYPMPERDLVERAVPPTS